MKFAVISDTHNHLPTAVVDAISAANVNEVWHLGDVTIPSTLDHLLAVGVPLRIVRGNCDHSADWPPTLTFAINGVRIHMQHIPPTGHHHPPANIDLFLHGHTHVPRDETIGGVRFLNPGTVGKPNRGAPPSYALLTIGDDGKVIWEVKLFKS